MVRDQLKKIQTAATQYELYRDQILPLARQTVEASRAAYETSTGGFLELITARRTLKDVESRALNRLAEYEAAIAELEAITGNPTANQVEKISQNKSNHARYFFGLGGCCVGDLLFKARRKR